MANSASRSLPDVPDILYHVFSYLDPVHHLRHEHDQLYESRRSLALAARTCRGFTGPALDILWKRLPDDQPLADLLCELGIAAKYEGQGDAELVGRNKPDRYRLPNQHRGGHCDREANKMFARQWRLSRGYGMRYYLQDTGDPRQHSGWPRFLEYASRVRAITLYAFDGPGWYGIWEELRSRADGAPILPNLLSVAFCRISLQAHTPGVLALIFPSVCKLNLNLGDECSWPPFHDNLRSLFSRCFTAAPEIDHLRLEFPLSRLVSPLLQSHCCRLRHLEVVRPLDPDSLRFLAELSALQHLSISLSREDFPASKFSLTFRSVSTLVVNGTWTNLAVFLTTTYLPSLHALSIAGWEYGEPAAELAQAATHVFHTLATKYPSLPALSVSATHSYEPPLAGCMWDGDPPVADTVALSLLDLVRPLLSLSALRHLSLVSPRYFDIVCTEADLRAVAEAFPALEAFHLHISHYDARRVNPFYSHPKELALVTSERPRGGPLAALAHFARGCPRLRVLHLPAMELTAPGGDEPRGGVMATEDEERVCRAPREPHGLRTLVIPKVLLPSGGADLVGRVSKVVGAAFPSCVSGFRVERLAVEGEWAVVVDCAASRCMDCERGSKITFA